MKESLYTRTQEFFDIYLKGLFMGMADIVPGISGGTIALIVGIYERLIFGIRNIKFKWIWYFLRGKQERARRDFATIDFALFVPLVLGIATAFLIFSEVISFFLNEFSSYTYAFFFGLVLASAYFVSKYIDHFSLLGVMSFVVGVVGAYIFVGLPAIQTNHSLPTIFISAVLAICAMILPGISGAFLLVVLGQYGYLLQALLNFDFVVIFAFLSGALIGLLSFARVVAWFLRHYKSLTMSFLLGMMLGALRSPYLHIVGNEFSLTLAIIFGIIGFIFVFVIEKAGNRTQQQASR